MLNNLSAISYNQEQELIQSYKEDTARLNTSKETVFSVTRHAGFVTQILGSEPYNTAAINVVPELTRISKAPGARNIAKFSDIDSFTGYTNLICGKVDIPNKGEYLFTMVRDNQKKQTSFYYLPEINNKLADYWIRLNPILANSKEEYFFKGNYFDLVQYKSLLFICSGKEEYKGFVPNGETITTGLLMLDLDQIDNGKDIWYAIPTGKAAPIDLAQGKIGKNIESEGQSNQLYNPSDLVNSLPEFNPSILEVYKDRLLISGATGNPFQIKVSEQFNPKNFVDNTLGYTVTPLTGEERRKASTFFVNQPVTSLNVLGENCYIGTVNRFYIYSLVEVSGVFEADRVIEDYTTLTGPVNNKAIKVAMGQMYFASNYQVIPELNSRQFETKVDSAGRGYTVASPSQKLTFFQDEYFKNCNVSNSTIGIYKNSILWSFADANSQPDEEGNTVNNKVFYYSKIGDTPCFAIWEHVQANYFAEIGKRGLIYSSSNDGNVYIINEDINIIDTNSDNPNIPQRIDYSSIIQSGVTGVGSKGNIFSRKRLKQIFLIGGISAETFLKVQVFPIAETCKNNDNCFNPIYETILRLTYDTSSCSYDPSLPDINFFNGIKYFKKLIYVPIDTQNPGYYNELYFRITVANSTDFYLLSYGGMYSSDQSMDDNLIIKSQAIINKDSVALLQQYDITGEQITLDTWCDCEI